MTERTRIELSDGMREILDRPVNGEGGFQSLIRKLRSQIVGGYLEVDAADVERLIRYAHEYGEGGFESRLRELKP